MVSENTLTTREISVLLFAELLVVDLFGGIKEIHLGNASGTSDKRSGNGNVGKELTVQIVGNVDKGNALRLVHQLGQLTDAVSIVANGSGRQHTENVFQLVLCGAGERLNATLSTAVIPDGNAGVTLHQRSGSDSESKLYNAVDTVLVYILIVSGILNGIEMRCKVAEQIDGLTGIHIVLLYLKLLGLGGQLPVNALHGIAGLVAADIGNVVSVDTHSGAANVGSRIGGGAVDIRAHSEAAGHNVDRAVVIQTDLKAEKLKEIVYVETVDTNVIGSTVGEGNGTVYKIIGVGRSGDLYSLENATERALIGNAEIRLRKGNGEGGMVDYLDLELGGRIFYNAHIRVLNVGIDGCEHDESVHQIQYGPDNKENKKNSGKGRMERLSKDHG